MSLEACDMDVAFHERLGTTPKNEEPESANMSFEKHRGKKIHRSRKSQQENASCSCEMS